MIYILKEKTELSEFIFSNLKDAKTIFYPVIKRNTFIQRVAKALYYRVWDKVYLNFFPKEVTSELLNIKSDDTLIIVGEDIYTYWVVSQICKEVKYKVAYFWNPQSTFIRQKSTRPIRKESNRAHAIISYIRNLGFSMATFDKGDADNFNMFFYPQFYKFVKEDPTPDFKYTFFFCGRDKGRREIIDFYEKSLTSFGSCKFVIMTDRQTTDPIPYHDYVNYIRHSRILCEAVQPNQIGLTVRAVEALFFNKKLITNNPSIKEYDIYNPNNILVLSSSTTVQEISTFVKTPMVCISNEVKRKYDVNTMAKTLDAYVKQ